MLTCRSENFLKLLTGFVGGWKNEQIPVRKTSSFDAIFGTLLDNTQLISHDVFFAVNLPSQFDARADRVTWIISLSSTCKFVSQYPSAIFS